MDTKYISIVLIIIAMLLLIYAISSYDPKTLQKEGFSTSALALVGAVCLIIVASALGIKARKDAGLSTSDYIQIGVVFFSVMSIGFIYYSCSGFWPRIMASIVALLAAAQLNDF